MTHAFSEEDIHEEDVIEEVHFEIDKNAFKGPYTCCDKQTNSIRKILSRNGLELYYEVWRCSRCKKEYLGTEQAKLLESFWSQDKTKHTPEIPD